MTRPYHVYWGSGEPVEVGEFLTFETALARIRWGLRRGIRNEYRVVNWDRADGGYGDDGEGTRNGLTEEESDMLNEVRV